MGISARPERDEAGLMFWQRRTGYWEVKVKSAALPQLTLHSNFTTVAVHERSHSRKTKPSIGTLGAEIRFKEMGLLG